MQSAVTPASEPGAWVGQGRASRSAVEISHLRKAYGLLVAIDDVSFSVTEVRSSASSARTGPGRPLWSSAP
jgi:hypothetical protein